MLLVFWCLSAKTSYGYFEYDETCYLQVMEPRSWRQLLYAVVYSVDLSALRSARSNFHSSVCNAMAAEKDQICMCVTRVAWVIVDALPMGASVQWHFATTQRRLLQPFRSVIAHNEGLMSIDTRSCRMLLFKVGVAIPSFLEIPVIVPVVRFLEESVNCAYVMVD